ncbi:MAG: glycosyltransferase 87 family protein [Acidimicrobiia bacterium]
MPKFAKYTLLALIAARVLVALWLTLGPTLSSPDAPFNGDVHRYHAIATSDGIPYRDFAVEYPPATLLNIELIGGFSIPTGAKLLVWTQLACDLAVAGALAYGWSKRASLAYLALSAATIVYPFIYLRTDLLSVALVTWGLALIRRRRDVASGATLAAGALAKMWCAALIPILMVRGKWKPIWCAAGFGAVGLAAWVAVGGTGAVMDVLSFRGAKGWQLESLPGSVVRLTEPLTVRAEQGAWRVGQMPEWGKSVLGLAMVVSVIAVAWLLKRSGRLDGVFADAVAPLTSVTAFLVFSPIISPQYTVWLLPFAALAWVGGEKRLALLTAAIYSVSALLIYWIDEYVRGDLAPVLWLWVRNVMLVLLLLDGFVRLWDAANLRRRAAPVVPLAALEPSPTAVDPLAPAATV